MKQVADVGVTEAKTPNLATKRRQEQRRARDEEEGGEEGGESFHAKPMPNFEKLQVCTCSNVGIYTCTLRPHPHALTFDPAIHDCTFTGSS